jgi:Uma2 family endonuclease
MTLAEFLAWEETQEERYEFDGFQPVAMTGGTFAHDAIGVNIVGELRERLRGKPCRPHGKDLKILIGNKALYPDAYVTCGQYEAADKHGRDPVVLFEVVSESSEQTDLFEKNEEYASLPSAQRYVILQQSRIGGMMFERRGGEWLGHVFGQNSVIHMPEIDIEIPIASLYEGVSFEKNDAG